MKNWVAGKKVLAGFGDPGGAKAILAGLTLFGSHSYSMRVVSLRKFDFCENFFSNVEIVSDHYLEELFVNINCLIVGTSYPVSLEVELIKIAKQFRIKTYAFVEHWVNFALRFKSGGDLILPDVIGVVNQRARFQAIQEGIPENLLVIIDNPYHKYLRNWQPNITYLNLKNKLGLKDYESYVVYAPEPISTFSLKNKFGFDEVCGLKAIIGALKKNKDQNVVLVVKAHPNQDKTYLISEINKESNIKIIFVDVIDFNTLIFHSKAIIGFYSSALLEANILGKPIFRPLYLANTDIPDSLAGELNNNARILSDQNELKNALKSLG